MIWDWGFERFVVCCLGFGVPLRGFGIETFVVWKFVVCCLEVCCSLFGRFGGLGFGRVGFRLADLGLEV